MQRLFSFILILVLYFQAHATHLIGGEIFYECLGNNRWVVGVTMYRDCYVQPGGTGAASFDNELYISIYKATNNQLLDVLTIYPSTQEYQLPLILNAPCMADTPDICVASLEYRDTFELAIPLGGVYLVNQRCCRTPNALNLIAPSNDFGSTYYCKIPDSTVAECNNSPRFNVVPPKVLCSNIDLDLDYSASDADGDSLVYSWCNPYHGGGPSGGSGANSPVPSIPTPPPFSSVVWSTGFTTQYQIPSSPAMQVNPTTGIVSGRPNQVGTYVTGICVKEYRNGVMINENRRDFQLTTAFCDIQANAAIDSTLEECIGLEIDFFNLSSLGSSFLWDFGDTNANDTSSIFNPSWIFSDTGTYTIQLIAFGDVCNDTTSIQYTVLPRIEADFTHSEPDCLDRHKYEFSPGGYYRASTEMRWSIDGDSNYLVSDNFGLKDIHFDSAGLHEVILTYLDFGCEKVKIDTVEVWPNPQMSLIEDNEPQCTPFYGEYFVTTLDANKPKFAWYLDSTFVESSDSFKVEVIDTGYHNIAIRLITDSLCIDTVDILANRIINVLDTPRADFYLKEYSAKMFDNNMNPFFEIFDSSVKALNTVYFIGDELYTREKDFVFYTQDTGTYDIHQIAVHENGCRDTLYHKFRLEPEYLIYIPNSFTPDGDGLNEGWRPVVFVEDDYLLEIYDRWGHLVFQTKDALEYWNGTHNNVGKQCPIGVYGYRVYVIDNEGLEWQYDGSVTLVR